MRMRIAQIEGLIDEHKKDKKNMKLYDFNY